MKMKIIVISIVAIIILASGYVILNNNNESIIKKDYNNDELSIKLMSLLKDQNLKEIGAIEIKEIKKLDQFSIVFFEVNSDLWICSIENKNNKGEISNIRSVENGVDLSVMSINGNEYICAYGQNLESYSGVKFIVDSNYYDYKIKNEYYFFDSTITYENIVWNDRKYTLY